MIIYQIQIYLSPTTYARKSVQDLYSNRYNVGSVIILIIGVTNYNSAR